MTFQQLRYAIGISRYGSISEAAGRLFVSQPSLSASMRELEEELGIRIFSRSSRGVSVTREGSEFLGYARQIIEQAELLESRYRGGGPRRQLFAVSTQHYAFVVNAFVEAVRELGVREYECALRETMTHEIIEDVRGGRSDVGVLYRNEFNAQVLKKILHEGDLEFFPLFAAKPHVFVGAGNPLAARPSVAIDDLEEYPCLSFEQGEYNSFHFSEEIQSALIRRKAIKVTDRATLFNLLIGLDGYTISTGVLTSDLNGNAIVAVPLALEERIEVGYVVQRGAALSRGAIVFLERLKGICAALA
jgi:DNA-binding transcriptional LysR family regulator